MANIFDTIFSPRLKRDNYDLSHDVKLTCDFGKLVPFLCEETVPNDTWYLKSDVLLRMAALIAPIYHNVYVTTHYFYVPFRIIWDDYETFETGGKDGRTVPTFPRLPLLGSAKADASFRDTNGLFAHGSLADFLNYPTSEENDSAGGMMVSALAFRAYQMIYNEYYRDENLEPELEFGLGSGVINPSDADFKTLLTLRNRAWMKDYFTSALPWPQKGATQYIPNNTTGKINDSSLRLKNLSSPSSVLGVTGSGSGTLSKATGERNPILVDGMSAGGSLVIDNTNNLELADDGVTIKGTSFTVADLRNAIAAQHWLEVRARGGNRYKETIYSLFGKTLDDGRIMRPEFLGGGVNPLQVNDVVQTSQTTSSSPQGQYAGLGYSFGSSNGFKRSFPERGYIIGIMSVMPSPGYVEGLPRMYRKFDPKEFFIPQFQELGEQQIYNYEVSLRQGADKLGEFGYTPRYAEYKYIPSRVHGDFKDMKSYGYWTLNRHYATAPTLNKEFIECDADKNDLNRIFAVTDATVPKMLVQIHNTVKARRPMKKFAEPGITKI